MDEQLGCGYLTGDEIDALLDDRLDADRRRALGDHVDAGCGRCALLLADARVFAEAERGLTAGEGEAFDRQAEFVRARLRREARVAPPRSFGIWTVLAASLLLVAFGIWYFRGPGDDRGPLIVSFAGADTIAVEPMPFSAPPLLRGEPAARETWKRAEQAYADRKWSRVARMLDGDDSVDALLYRGVALLMMDESRRGLEALDAAWETTGAQELPRGAIAWYRALALIDRGDEEQARAMLEVAAESGPFVVEARAYSAELPPTKTMKGPQ